MNAHERQRIVDGAILIVMILLSSVLAFLGCSALRGQWRYKGPPTMGPFLAMRREAGQPVADVINATTLRVSAELRCSESEFEAVSLPPMTGQTYLLSERDADCAITWRFDGVQ